ncbi:hypothetical protein LTR28_002905, partial [Elasticomyces elasticus]
MAQDPRALLQKADTLASKAGGGFSFFGGRQEKWEAAVEAYISAANSFRVNKQGKEAGEIFEKVARLQTEKLSEPDDAANSYIEGAKSYRKDDPEAAARCLSAAVSHFTGKGNFRRAATQYAARARPAVIRKLTSDRQQQLAELYEIEIGDNIRAVEAYVAELSALSEQYEKAIEHFMAVAKSSIDNQLMKWSVKEYLLKAGICHLATG